LLASVTDGTRTVTFGHTGDNLTSFTDANGRVTTYTYDGANGTNPGLMTAKTYPEGNTAATQTYTAAGRVQTQTDGAGTP